MKIEEMKRIAEQRTKGEWFIDDCRIPIGLSICLKDVPGDEDDLIATAEYEISVAEFIIMVANNFDKIMAVVEAAKLRLYHGHDEYCQVAHQFNHCVCNHDKLSDALQALER